MSRAALALVAAVAAVTAIPAAAQETPPETRTLRVATKSTPPFAVQGDDGAWRGIAVDLWRDAAAELGYATELVAVDLETMVAGVADGRFDAAVGAVTLTAERELRVDFTHPYHSAGIGIAASATARRGGLGAIRRLLSPAFWGVVAVLAGLLLLTGLLVWLAERRRNAAHFGGRPAHGIGAGFWWAAVTMTTVGYGDKAPVTVPGRLLGLVWMFTSLIVISSFTAAITSALTVGQLAAKVTGPEDLPRVRVATVRGTTSEEWLDALDVAHRPLSTAEEAVTALAAGEVDAVVYDQPILQHLVRRHGDGELRVLPQVLEPQLYGFVLASGSALREPLNRAILRRVNTPEWQALLDAYLER